MPSELDIKMEQKFIASGGKLCPYDGIKVEDHANTPDSVKDRPSVCCILLASEVARYAEVRRPQPGAPQ